ncbi:restriction endonuclease subunit S [Acaryochloris marina NIES-2412]|uniref:restriction endonuclease subunit S n=1 Tax=Acaryochloris marina TaxID=155978 RepID=UPI0040597B11
MKVQQLPFLDVLKDASGGNKKTPQKEFLENGEIPVVDQGQQLIAGYINDKSRICKSDPPVIVFGDHTRAIKYVDFKFAMGADGTKVLIPKIDADTKYLYYALRTLHIPSAGYSRHYKFLKESKIPFFPIAEQKRIAGILDAADALRVKRRDAIASLDTLLQSTFLTLFGDPVTNPMGWEVISLENLCERIVDCPHSTPKYSDTPTSFFCIRSSDIQNGSLDLSEARYVNSEVYNERILRHEPSAGEVVYTREGGRLGLTALIPPDNKICLGQRMMLFSAEPNIACNTFIWGFLNSSSVYRKVVAMSGGGAAPRVNIKQLKQLDTIFPPLDKQKLFRKILQAIEKQKSKQRAHLAELDILFASLQSRAFNGEL